MLNRHDARDQSRSIAPNSLSEEDFESTDLVMNQDPRNARTDDQIHPPQAELPRFIELVYAEEVRLTCISKEEKLSHVRLVAIVLEMFKHTSLAKADFLLQYAYEAGKFVTVRTDADVKVAQLFFESFGENSTLRFAVHGIPNQVEEVCVPFIGFPGNDKVNVSGNSQQQILHTDQKMHQNCFSHLKTATDVVSLVCKEFFDENRRPIRGELRNSVQMSDAVDQTANWNDVEIENIGQLFTFTNREEQCKELLRAWAQMDKHRGFNDFDLKKRNISVPVCTGIPGIGKTRFARVAVWHLACQSFFKTHGKRKQVSLENLVSTAPDLASDTWGEKHNHLDEKIDLIQSLLCAYRYHRNIRIDMSHMISSSLNEYPDGLIQNLQTELASQILIQCCKYMPRRTFSNHKDFGRVLQDALRREKLGLTVLETIRYVTRKECFFNLSDKTTTGTDPAVIINLDEAQNWFSLLKPSLHAILEPLVCQNLRVFVTITGLSSEEVTRRIDASSVRPHDIFLPLLTEHHMKDILRDLLELNQVEKAAYGTDERVDPHRDEGNAVPNAISYALWWLGGIPRFLEYFITCITEKWHISRPNILSRLKNSCHEASYSEMDDAIRMTQERAYCYLLRRSSFAVPDGILDNIFSLALSERKVSANLVLKFIPGPIYCEMGYFSDSHWTVSHAQANQLLYWEPTERGVGIVRLPPLVLHIVHERSGRGTGPNVIPLQRPSAYLSAQDNEGLTMAAILHRLRAAAIAGITSINLSELVGMRPVYDIELEVPKCFDIEVLEQRIESKHFQDEVFSRRSNALISPQHTRIALINGRGAAHADGFVIFSNHILLVQEKQCVTARKRFIEDKKVSAMPANDAEVEYKKIGLSCQGLAHTMLYVTDLAANPRVKSLPNVVIVTREFHTNLFGSLIARLRANAVEESGTRLESDDLRRLAQMKR
jgi:hypothetical protein